VTHNRHSEEGVPQDGAVVQGAGGGQRRAPAPEGELHADRAPQSGAARQQQQGKDLENQNYASTLWPCNLVISMIGSDFS
jgi:hypothetical protein